MFMQGSAKLALWVLVACLSLTLVSRAAEPGGNRPAATEAASTLRDMPAGKFFTLEKIERPIDPTALDHTLLAAAIFHETNRRRQQSDRQSLDYHAKLDKAARMHAVSMAQGDYFSHTNPSDPERRTALDRVKLVGFTPRFLSENIATHFGIRYEEGRRIYPVPSGTGFSYQPGGSPIPRHTYRSFVTSLLDQWMNSAGHRKNILSAQPRLFGAGCSPSKEKNGMTKFYCVQLFGD